jgi:hypothetical protein
MADFLDTVKEFFTKDRDKLVNTSINASHVDQVLNPQPLEAGRHYFRLRLAEMYLKKQVAGMKEWYPAVQSLVNFQFGEEKVEIPFVADSSKIGDKVSKAGDVTVRRVPLTPLMPFSGGDINLAIMLYAVEGENFFQNFIGVLGKFSSLLNVPQLSSALAVAGPLATAVQTLIAGGSTRGHLGFVDSFSGGKIAEGYIVSIRAPETKVKVNRLWVVDDQLRIGDSMANNVPYQDFDHMLLHVELTEQRDDWEALKSINGAYQEARAALKDAMKSDPPDPAKLTEANFLLTVAKLHAKDAPELTRAHKRIVVQELNKKFEEDKGDFVKMGAAGTDVTLEQLVRRGMTVEEAMAATDPSDEDIYSMPEVTPAP